METTPHPEDDRRERPLERLRRIMARLRDPEAGCAWDVAQSFASIAPYTIEEAYEVADAIERGAIEDELKDELGDLLLQVVFHARMAEEAGLFDFDDVATAICDKLVRRHPHVFGDGTARTPEEIKAMWDVIKAEEKAGKPRPSGLLADVPVKLPPLARAQKLQKRMAKVGFDWPDAGGALDKVREELAELVEAERTGDEARKEAELGDLLFSLVNFARHAGIDAHAALRGTNVRFAARVRHMEAAIAADGLEPSALDLDEWDRLWAAAKAAEKG